MPSLSYTLPGPDGAGRTQAVQATFVAQLGVKSWHLAGAQCGAAGPGYWRWVAASLLLAAGKLYDSEPAP